MTHYEAADPKDIRRVFEKCFAVNKNTYGISTCGSIECYDCLFLSDKIPCSYAKKKWLDQLAIDWDKDINWAKVPVDTPVIVKNELDPNEHRRYFKEKDEFYITFDEGMTSWSAYAKEDNYVGEPWDICKLARLEDVEKYRKQETEK